MRPLQALLEICLVYMLLEDVLPVGISRRLGSGQSDCLPVLGLPLPASGSKMWSRPILAGTVSRTKR